MKKLFTVFFGVVLLSSITFAQDFAQKGIIELGGTVGFNSVTGVSDGESADESATQFWFNPYVGYFFMNNFEVGIIPTFSTYSLGDYSETGFGILLAPAYNFDLRNCWYPFIEGRIGYNTFSYDDGNSLTDDPSRSGLEWGLRGGVKAQVGKHALVNVGIFYEQVTMNPEDWDGGRIGYNRFGIEAGVAIFIY